MTEARLSDAPDRFAEGTPERLKHDVFVREKVIEHLQTEIAAMKADHEQATQQIAALTQELEKGERVFEAMVYAFEGREVPEDFREHSMVRRAEKQVVAQLLHAQVLKRAREAAEELRKTAEAHLTALQVALRDLLVYGQGESLAALTSKDRDQYQFWQGWTMALDRGLLSVPQEPTPVDIRDAYTRDAIAEIADPDR